MKNKEEKTPQLVKNLIQMHEYPNLFSEGHWDILIWTLKMLFSKLPEMNIRTASGEELFQKWGQNPSTQK